MSLFKLFVVEPTGSGYFFSEVLAGRDERHIDEEGPAGAEEGPAGGDERPTIDEKGPAGTEEGSAGGDERPTIDEEGPAGTEKGPVVTEEGAAGDEGRPADAAGASKEESVGTEVVIFKCLVSVQLFAWTV